MSAKSTIEAIFLLVAFRTWRTGCISDGAGLESYDLTESIAVSERWFELVESTRLFTRRMILSRGALLWLCKRLKLLKVGGKTSKHGDAETFQHIFIAP
ncbi:hypothetical protein H5410_004962 [Solanum commersonii]|uniref:Secreted protein n=1 Tax=Solanum commersonii TaxID=4109 RepID=A0A9J6A5V2_SOLCO|nr:hypothetical protein H5410_004962 [Solanum commersonii]